MSDLSIPVPQTVNSHLIVAAASKPPNDLDARLRRAVADPSTERGPFVSAATAALEIGGLNVAVHPARSSPWREQLRNVGSATGDAFFKLQEAPHHIVIANATPPAAQPLSAQASRFVARLVAQAVDSDLIVDMASRQILEWLRYEPEQERFVLRDDWLAVFCRMEEGSEDVLEASTEGLARFGFPELAAPRLPLDVLVGGAKLIRALASRLLTEHWQWLRTHPGSLNRSLPQHQRVSAGDYLRYDGQTPTAQADEDEVKIQLTSTATGGRPTLIVGPAPGYNGQPVQWWTDVVAPRFLSL